MNFKTCLSTFALLVAVASCGSDEPAPTPTPTPAGSKFEGFLFTSVITNPAGNSGTVYLQGLASFPSGKVVDNRNAVPMGFGANPVVTTSGNIYTFPDYLGATKPEVSRYVVDSAGQLIKQGALDIPANGSASNIVELNREKAYLTLQGLGRVLVFNPTTMKAIKHIDLNHLKQEGCNVSPAAMIIRDGMLFVGLNQMNANYMPQKNNLEFALIDTQADTLKKHIVNTTLGLSFATRPVDPNSIFMDEDKNIYFNCIGAFGFSPNFPSGIARIKNGSTEIDPEYSVSLKTTEIKGLESKKGDCIMAVYYAGKGKLYAYVSVNALDPEATNPYLTITHIPVVIDLAAKTITRIEGMEVSNPQGIAIGQHKGNIVFGSANKKAYGFYTYNPTTGKVEGPVLQTTGFPSFFYSFTK